MATVNTSFQHPEWSKSANIYQVNLRQYSEAGDIQSFRQDLPRLKELGVDIIWLMPIHPIGEKERKGSLGSPYSVKDYYGVCPTLGTLDDFKVLVDAVHELGMYIIMDWVANHSAWDNRWVTEHPEWYLKNAQGEIHSYVYDNGEELEYWDDVVGFDYTQKPLWDEMENALKYWVQEANIDGYRCDVAGLVPTPFWERVRATLDEIKPVFMLAEWSTVELHEKSFDMTYNWDFYDVMKSVVAGKPIITSFKEYLSKEVSRYPYDAYRMAFTTNHDKNSWDECDVKIFGDALKAYLALTMTFQGMPLIYNGQESGLGKKLAFFEKDTIDWKTFAFTPLIKELFFLKKNNPALWNGQYGSIPEILEASNGEVIVFSRQKENNKVIICINFSSKQAAVTLNKTVITLEPYGFKAVVEQQ